MLGWNSKAAERGLGSTASNSEPVQPTALEIPESWPPALYCRFRRSGAGNGRRFAAVL